MGVSLRMETPMIVDHQTNCNLGQVNFRRRYMGSDVVDTVRSSIGDETAKINGDDNPELHHETEENNSNSGDESSDLHNGVEESDSYEDEVALRNTVGDVPLDWYKDEEHIGYDLAGKKIKKKAIGWARCPVTKYRIRHGHEAIKLRHFKHKLIKKLETGLREVSTIAVHPAGDNVIVGRREGKLCWFDMDLSSKPYRVLRCHPKDSKSQPKPVNCTSGNSSRAFELKWKSLRISRLQVPSEATLVIYGRSFDLDNCKCKISETNLTRNNHAEDTLAWKQSSDGDFNLASVQCAKEKTKQQSICCVTAP
ncbi:hypothetical protein MLD38_022864 [Melastoma candidum]|uniref:Uncharacterized protein n=1 Tax=Melastoma candidum TaxID=119954 RepID=A0ACB9QLW0_9MYRT|nr:hypothetical protein MLD38_022864 [Melastoma candidum]